MNERIRELAEQAGMVRGGWSNTPEKIMTWRESFDNPGSLKKFAELIIRECAYRIDDLVTSDDDGNQILECDDVKTELLEHFGVEQ